MKKLKLDGRFLVICAGEKTWIEMSCCLVLSFACSFKFELCSFIKLDMCFLELYLPVLMDFRATPFDTQVCDLC